jgi:ribosomal protein S2
MNDNKLITYFINIKMTATLTPKLEQMVKAGMHLGHEARKWNPKMKRSFILKKNNIILLI